MQRDGTYKTTVCRRLGGANSLPWCRKTGAALVAVVIMASALVLTVPARAGDEQAAQPSRQSPSCGSPQVTKNAGLYDVDASGTDIRFVIEALARCSQVSIVVSPEISGEITAHLRQMPVESILDYLSVVRGFAWKNSGGTYLVAAKDTLEKPPAPQPESPLPQPQLLVWRCRHVRPSDVVSAIQNLFPKIKVVEGPGLLTPALDSSTGGLSGTSTGHGTLAPASYSSAGQTAASATSNTNCVVLVGDPQEVAKAKEALEQLDVGRPQVSIKVAITEVTSSAKEDLGIDWTYSDLVLTESAPDSAIKFGRLTRQGVTFTGTVSALIQHGAAKLLAQPNISVVDGERANILIGDRILFPKLIGYSQFGTPIYDKEEERVGISLQIAPRVTGTDEILLTLYPQVSLVTSFLKTQAGDYPQISTREARTTVSVKSGATLAIGGLLRDDEIKNVSRIPLLGDLPVIGGLFRQTKKTKERNEIVIFLSPTIVDVK